MQGLGERDLQDGWTKEEYILKIENSQKQLCTEAVVEKRERRGLIRERKFTVKERGLTAVDHAAVIVQAYLLLKERVQEQR